MTFISSWQPSLALAWMFVFCAILCNAMALSALKFMALAQDATTVRLWLVINILSYLPTPFFLFFSQKVLPASVGYTIWLGMLAAGMFVSGLFFFGESLTVRGIMGTALIVLGCVLLFRA